MKIHEAIKMLQKMNPNEEVFIQFKEDVVEQRNNEHLKEKPLHEKLGIDERDLYYRGT
jgi:hypothetical protein